MTEQEFREIEARTKANGAVFYTKAGGLTAAGIAEQERRATEPAQKRRGAMNKLEARFRAEIIQPCIDRGEIQWADFECLKFRLADGAWYTPDIAVWCVIDDSNYGHTTLILYEVKGHWREAARVRIKVAADKYPFVFVAVTRNRKTGEWEYERIPGRQGKNA